jgi:hypothetical protein
MTADQQLYVRCALKHVSARYIGSMYPFADPSEPGAYLLFTKRGMTSPPCFPLAGPKVLGTRACGSRHRHPPPDTPNKPLYLIGERGAYGGVVRHVTLPHARAANSPAVFSADRERPSTITMNLLLPCIIRDSFLHRCTVLYDNLTFRCSLVYGAQGPASVVSQPQTLLRLPLPSPLVKPLPPRAAPPEAAVAALPLEPTVNLAVRT